MQTEHEAIISFPPACSSPHMYLFMKIHSIPDCFGCSQTYTQIFMSRCGMVSSSLCHDSTHAMHNANDKSNFCIIPWCRWVRWLREGGILALFTVLCLSVLVYAHVRTLLGSGHAVQPKHTKQQQQQRLRLPVLSPPPPPAQPHYICVVMCVLTRFA